MKCPSNGVEGIALSKRAWDSLCAEITHRDQLCCCANCDSYSLIIDDDGVAFQACAVEHASLPECTTDAIRYCCEKWNHG
jgi:hypothetical protein